MESYQEQSKQSVEQIKLEQKIPVEESIAQLKTQIETQSEQLKQISELFEIKQEDNSLLSSIISHVKDHLLTDLQQQFIPIEQFSDVSNRVDLFHQAITDKNQEISLLESKIISIKDRSTANYEDIQKRIGEIKYQLDDKASSQRIEREFNKKANITELRSMQSLIKEQFTEKLDKQNQDIKKKLQQLNQTLEDMYYTKEVIDQMQKQNNKTYLKIDMFESFQDKNQDLIKTTRSDINKQIQKHENKIKFIESDIQDVQKTLELKTDISETSRTWKQFEKYCQYSDLKELYQKVMPSLKNFEDKMQLMSKEYEQSKEIIMRYDEVISEKASKTSLLEVYQYFEDYLKQSLFLDHKLQYEQKMEDMKKEMEKFNETLQIINENISKDIFSAVRRATAQITKNNQNNTSTASGLSGLDIILKGLLNSKAEKKDLEILNDIKSNKIDTEEILKSIDILHKQIVHIVVLLIEHVKSSIQNTTDTQKTIQKKRKYILEQGINVCDWIHKFNPQNINNEDLILPKSLNKLEEHSKSLVNEYPKIEIRSQILRNMKKRDSQYYQSQSPMNSSNLKGMRYKVDIIPSQQLENYLQASLKDKKGHKKSLSVRRPFQNEEIPNFNEASILQSQSIEKSNDININNNNNEDKTVYNSDTSLAEHQPMLQAKIGLQNKFNLPFIK